MLEYKFFQSDKVNVLLCCCKTILKFKQSDEHLGVWWHGHFQIICVSTGTCWDRFAGNKVKARISPNFYFSWTCKQFFALETWLMTYKTDTLSEFFPCSSKFRNIAHPTPSHRTNSNCRYMMRSQKCSYNIKRQKINRIVGQTWPCFTLWSICRPKVAMFHTLQYDTCNPFKVVPPNHPNRTINYYIDINPY